MLCLSDDAFRNVSAPSKSSRLIHAAHQNASMQLHWQQAGQHHKLPDRAQSTHAAHQRESHRWPACRESLAASPRQKALVMAPTAASFRTPVLSTCGPLHKSTMGPHLQWTALLSSDHGSDISHELLMLCNGSAAGWG